MQSSVRQKLAVKGGTPVRTKLFPAYRPMGEEEKRAASRVIDSGVLSQFLGCWHKDFYGGPEVRGLEEEWAKHFGVKHAITVNSATSALFAAVGATGVEPGDEVIVSPYTMSASAIAPIIYNAIPVFADIDENTYCLDPASVESRITPRTRAIIVVDLFGHPYDADALNTIAKKHNLLVIEDCAQAPGATYNGKMAGTLADIGVYSLNYHKHIHTGEGGIMVTNDDRLAERMRLIRNHAEAVLQGKHTDPSEWTPELLSNMLGFNYRMTEIEAAIGREQLKKLDGLLNQRWENIDYLNKRLGEIPCIETTYVQPGATHAYYVHPLKFRPEAAEGLVRNTYLDAVKAELAATELREGEGVRIAAGYVKPLYTQPMYQKRIAYGTKGHPWTAPFYKGTVDYSDGICPVVERVNQVHFCHDLMKPPLTRDDLDDVVNAFVKVWENRDQLV